MIKRRFLVLTLTSLSGQLAAYNAIEPPMVTIPSGEFLMGSNTNNANEMPVHQVTIDTFKLAKFEVTVKEFRQFIEATGYIAPQECYHQPTVNWLGKKTKGSWDNNALSINDLQPVVCINAKAATAYASWLSQQTGKSYRLPSEAEWEYAARAGSNTKYYFGNERGDTRICEYANISDITAEQRAQQDFGATYIGTTGITKCDDQSGYASIVGMYTPNAFGVYDLIGNINEYVQDCNNSNYYKAPTDGSAWLTGDCERRVLRGGAWHWGEFSSSQRSAMPTNFSGVLEGFRLAQDLSNDSSNESTENSADNIPQSTKQFEAALAKAQKSERARRLNILPFPAKPTGLKLKNNTDDRSITLSWNANSENEVTGYNVYQAQAFGVQYRKVASNISGLKFIDPTPVARKHSYVVSAVNRDRFSEYSESVTTADTLNTIPGTIQAEDYNQMAGMLVDDSDDTGSGLILTGWGSIRKGNWAEYQVNVKSGSFYKLSYRVASPKSSDGFELLVNDKVTATFTIPATGGYKKWQTVTGQDVYLKAGTHTLVVKAIADSWKLNWFSFEAVSG